MGIKITKAEHDALPDSLKAKFTADGDSYVLQEEDVEGLKKSKADILKEKKDLQDRFDELAKFKADHEKSTAEADEAKQKEAGQFAELEKKLRDKITEVEGDRDTRLNAMRSTIKTERLKNLLAERGVRPEMTKYALLDVDGDFELGDDFSLKYKNGIGDAGEIDGVIAKLRESTPDFFKATTQSGGGASGSGSNGGAAAKQWTRAQWDTASTEQRSDFSSAGGQVRD